MSQQITDFCEIPNIASPRLILARLGFRLRPPCHSERSASGVELFGTPKKHEAMPSGISADFAQNDTQARRKKYLKSVF